MKTTKTVSKMSDMVIECELRSVWAEVESNIRHGVEPRRSLGDYAAQLIREQQRRAA